MNLKTLAIRGLFWSVIQKWGGLFFHSAALLVLTRLLTPEAFGLVALANVVIAFIRIFVEQGFSQSIIQAKQVEKEDLDTAFWSSLLISVALSILTFIGAETVANKFQEPELALILKGLSPLFILISLSSVQSALLQKNLQFKSLAVRSLIALSVGGFFAITFAFMGFGVWSLVVQELSRSLVAVIVLWKVGKWRPRFVFSFTSLKKLLSFGVSIMGINLLNVVNRRSDDLLIGYFLGTAALGYYNVAYQLLLLLTQLINAPVNQVALSAFSKLQDRPDELRKSLYNSARIVSFFSIPAFFFAAILAPEVVPFVFGSQWEKSIPVMQVLALIGPIHALGGLDSNLLIALGKPSWRLGFNFLNAAINFPAFLIAVHWGIFAVAAAYVIRGYLLFPFPLIAVKKLAEISYKDYLYSILPILLSGLVGIISILITIHFGSLLKNQLYLIIVAALSGTISYLVCIYYASPNILQQLPRLVRAKA